jgi:hypothetical protein
MDIGEKIQVARDLCARWSEALRNDPAVARGIEELRALSGASREVSIRSGIVELCRRCDEEEGGSCCGAGIENRYTPEMLLINMLMGVEGRVWDLPGGDQTPVASQKGRSCRFLGECGCLLAARDIICINYLCAKAREELPPEELAALQETTGREMEAVFALHGLVTDRLRRLAG